MDRRHTDREYEGELETLREQVLMMGARVEEMMTLALRAFSEQNPRLAASTIAQDRLVDAAEMQIDELCLRVLALRQPVASDLRFITTTLKLVTDLERIADLCVNLCERVAEFDDEPALRVTASITQVGGLAQSMVHDALDAFVEGDALKAEQVMDRDETVDRLHAALIPELVLAMTRDPAVVPRGIRLISIAKYLERVADHATNIAEMVVFMVRGQDVRHMQS
ncbi:MAG TPA: phosphate signaling complex protein PhoU [Polyangiaceae bacterium]|jgi:phosphate transport system protein|nr:phosphate signaling complex protein PhoU [Polyangiaceae bacterium]